MRITQPRLLLALIPALALAFGILDYRMPPPEPIASNLVLFQGALTILLVSRWFLLDARDRGYRPSFGLRFMMLGLTAFALPYYLFRSRGTRDFLKASLAAAGVFAITMIAYSLPARAMPQTPRAPQRGPLAEKRSQESAKGQSAATAPRHLLRTDLPAFPGYKRDEAQTFLTLPEWLLVYSPDEYARWMAAKKPSEFPYFGSIEQFWSYYRDVYDVTKEHYPFNWGYHAMVFVIGSSFTFENAVKGVYEGTIGRLSEVSGGEGRTSEDEFAARVAKDYVAFIRIDPWYEYSFATELKKLWAENSLIGAHPIRKWERRVFLSLEYLGKAEYATLIKIGTKAAYGDADEALYAIVHGGTDAVFRAENGVQITGAFDDGSRLVSLPRYEDFRDAVVHLARKGVSFESIAGNETILVTAIAPATSALALPAGRVLFEKPILTEPTTKRVAISAPVKSLDQILLALPKAGATIEHVYDY